MDEIALARDWVREANGRVLFLLGAGASKPALPVSDELTKIVMGSIDEAIKNWAPESHIPELWREIRPVLEVIGSNVEDVYQAVETLTYQDTDPTRFWVTGFTPFTGYKGGPAELRQDAKWILDMIQDHALAALDKAQAEAPFDHFRPLLEAPKIGIVSLNYDQLVEMAGVAHGIPVSTGAALWQGGLVWEFEPGAVPLLKLHGSMTWRGSRSLNHETGNMVPAMGFYEVASRTTAAPNRLLTPTVIFGTGSKSNPYSAFPALTRRFHDWLDESDLLVVAGYSFRDEHVDAAIRRWASLAPQRRIIVIDPFPRRTIRQDDGVLGGLLWAMDVEFRPMDWNTASAAASVGTRRMVFLTDTAGVATQFPELLSK